MIWKLEVNQQNMLVCFETHVLVFVLTAHRRG